MASVNDPIAKFKSWIYPSLVSILAAIIWHDVNEIKNDVKVLMAQSNIDKTRIDNLERTVYNKAVLSIPNPPNKLPSQVLYHEMVAVKPKDDEQPIAKRKLLEYL